MKFLRLLLIIILTVFSTGLFSQSLIDQSMVKKKPYFKNVLKTETDTTTYYLSEFNSEEQLPLIVFVQGSGFNSLFVEEGEAIVSKYGHANLPDLARNKARILLIEKPGVEFLDDYPKGERNKYFDQNFSLESWSERIVKIITFVTKNEEIDKNKILVIGHSEGGVVAARVAHMLGENISNVSIIAGEGSSQLYSLFSYAKSGIFFKDKGENSKERISYLTDIWSKISKDPLSTTKMFWGFTYKRWHSFLKTSVMEELSKYNGKILITQGQDDVNVNPEASIFLYTSLLSKGINVQLNWVEGADHSFNIKNEPKVNGWRNAFQNVIDWFLFDLTPKHKTIIETFTDVDSLLTKDNGKFWGKQLYGPILLVEPKTRLFYSNENNNANSFDKINSIYKDSLPSHINVANTVVEWDSKRWAIVMLPLPTNRIVRNNLIIHELFHRLQPEIGFQNLQELNNGHLDTYNGRLLLKLELQALEKALNSNDHSSRLEHIENALIFRNKRHTTKEIKNAENTLELNEGLAEYTAIMLSGRNEQEMKLHLSKSKNSFYTNATFVRSFAYQTIPLYGYLLSYQNMDWHKEIDNNTNLTDYFIKSFEIDPETDKSMEEVANMNNYDYQQIEKTETKREKTRLDKISEYKVKFVDKPTLELLFQNMNISFDPRNVMPIENLGTVYPTLRVTDNWGILTVENGALLASDWSKVTVSDPTKITDNLVQGNGWKLELKPNWQVVKKENEFKLMKKE